MGQKNENFEIRNCFFFLFFRFEGNLWAKKKGSNQLDFLKNFWKIFFLGVKVTILRSSSWSRDLTFSEYQHTNRCAIIQGWAHTKKILEILTPTQFTGNFKNFSDFYFLSIFLLKHVKNNCKWKKTKKISKNRAVDHLVHRGSSRFIAL